MAAQEKSIHLNNLTDEKVFESVFREYYAPLVNFAFRYAEEKETAEEIVQSVFLKLWEKSAEIEIQTTVKSYLFGAVRNAALNFLKHQKIEKAYAERQIGQGSFFVDTNFLELDELKEKIDCALKKIPEKCREIFELNRFEDKRYKEIAEMLGLSLKTVENQMGKALKILREELGEYLPVVLFILMHGGKI